MDSDALHKTPDDRLRERLAFALIRAGRPADAEPIARSLLQTNAGNADALLLLGLARRATHSPDADATLRQFLKVAPDHPAAAQVERLLNEPSGGAAGR